MDNNKKILKEAFNILRDLDCDKLDCDKCYFKDDLIESKCHLTKPMNKYIMDR
jgi:hypothetical protein